MAVKTALSDPEVYGKVLEMHPSWIHLLAHPFLHAENMEMQEYGQELVAAHIAQYRDHPDHKGYIGLCVNTSLSSKFSPFYLF